MGHVKDDVNQRLQQAHGEVQDVQRQAREASVAAAEALKRVKDRLRDRTLERNALACGLQDTAQVLLAASTSTPSPPQADPAPEPLSDDPVQGDSQRVRRFFMPPEITGGLRVAAAGLDTWPVSWGPHSVESLASKVTDACRCWIALMTEHRDGAVRELTAAQRDLEEVQIQLDSVNAQLHSVRSEADRIVAEAREDAARARQQVGDVEVRAATQAAIAEEHAARATARIARLEDELASARAEVAAAENVGTYCPR